MKRAAAFFAAALTVGLLTVQAHAASLYPVSEEGYTYGSFDELRIDKVYELTWFDDPADIPTGDFDRDGYHYTFLNMVKIGQSETDSNGNTVTIGHDTVIYTATFVCRGKAKTSGQNQPEGADSLERKTERWTGGIWRPAPMRLPAAQRKCMPAPARAIISCP